MFKVPWFDAERGMRFKKAREDANVSISDIGYIKRIQGIESGKIIPSPTEYARYATMCGVRKEWLRTGEEPMK